MLVLIFIYFTVTICIDQVTRFLTDPFILTLERHDHSWRFRQPAITICSDYANDSYIIEVFQRSKDASTDHENRTLEHYRHYMKIIGALNAENVHRLIDQFEHTTLFKNLSGEELLAIASNV